MAKSQPRPGAQRLGIAHSCPSVGSGPQVAAKLRALADTLGVDELVVITWTHDPAARRRSYELLAREFLDNKD